MKNNTYIITADPECLEDKRYVSLAKSIKEDGFHILAYGSMNIEGIERISSLADRAGNCILVLPFSLNEEQAMSAIKMLPDHSYVVGGVLSERCIGLVKEKSLRYKNILNDEEFCLENAIPTSEGTLALAINATDETIWNMKCGIFGYGKIGTRSADLFKWCGADVSVFSAVKKELNIAKMRGLKGYLLPMAENTALKQLKLIINTIPARHIIDAEILKQLDKKCYIIDLASGGNNIDWLYARETGLSAVHATALPGKTAPVSAAEYIKDAIYRATEE